MCIFYGRFVDEGCLFQIYRYLFYVPLDIGKKTHWLVSDSWLAERNLWIWKYGTVKTTQTFSCGRNGQWNFGKWTSWTVIVQAST